LDDQVDSVQMRAGIVEEMTQQGGGLGERRAAQDAIWPRRQPNGQKIPSHNPDSAHGQPARTLCKLFRPVGVELDGDHVGAPPGHGHGERAGTGAGLDDELRGADIRLPDEKVSGVRTQEVLTETASSLVPGRPPTGGHGASPWWSSAFGLAVRCLVRQPHSTLDGHGPSSSLMGASSLVGVY